MQPKTAIVSTSTITKESQNLLQEKQIKHYLTGQQGAIIWQPETGFQTTLK